MIQTRWTFDPLSSSSKCSKCSVASRSLFGLSIDLLFATKFSCLNHISPCSLTSSISGVLKACSQLEPPSLQPPHLLQWHPYLLTSMDIRLCLALLYSPSCAMLPYTTFLSHPACNDKDPKEITFFTTLCSFIFLSYSCPKVVINRSLLGSICLSPPIPFSIPTQGSS